MVTPGLCDPLGQVVVNHPVQYDPRVQAVVNHPERFDLLGLVVQNHLALEVYGHRGQIHLVHQATDRSDRQVRVAQVVHQALVR